MRNFPLWEVMWPCSANLNRSISESKRKSWMWVLIKKTTLTFLIQHWLLKVLRDLVFVSTDWQHEMKVLSLALHLEPRWTPASGWNQMVGTALCTSQNKTKTKPRADKGRLPPVRQSAHRCCALNAEASSKTNEFRALTSYLLGNTAQLD